MDWIASALVAAFVFIASIGAMLAVSDPSPWEFWTAKVLLLVAAFDFGIFVIYSLVQAEWPTAAQSAAQARRAARAPRRSISHAHRSPQARAGQSERCHKPPQRSC